MVVVVVFSSSFMSSYCRQAVEPKFMPAELVSLCPPNPSVSSTVMPRLHKGFTLPSAVSCEGVGPFLLLS